MTLLETLQAQNTLLPGTIEWQTHLQQAYTTFKPSLADFTQAIYTAWSTQAPDARVSFVQMTGVLTRITDGGNPVYSAGDITTAANAFYMEVVIFVDTVGLRQASASNGGEPFNASPYISMSDNHPTDDGNSGGTCELDDEGLVGNMTIHWVGRTNSGSAPTDKVSLVAFQMRNGGIWTLLASPPVRLHDGSWVSYANPVPTPNTTLTYAFDFTINDSPVSFWFDPHIGDHDERRLQA